MRAYLAICVLLVGVPVRADSTTCRRDSGGHLVCRSDRCTTTCRTDSGGHLVCREQCQ